MSAVCLLLTVARSEKFCSIRMTFFLSIKMNICDLLTSMKCLVRQKKTNKLMKWDYLWILVSEWYYRAVFQNLKKSLSTICRDQHRIMYPYFFQYFIQLKKEFLNKSIINGKSALQYFQMLPGELDTKMQRRVVVDEPSW